MTRDLLTLFELIEKYNLTETRIILKCESGITESMSSITSSSLSDQYSEFYKFVNNSSTIHHPQLRVFLYPVFVHIYFHLLSTGQTDQANKFLTRFAKSQEIIYKRDILDLQMFPLSCGDGHNCLLDIFRANKFAVRISRLSWEYVQQNFLENKIMKDLSNLINENLKIDLIEKFPRNEMEIDCCRGGFSGESIPEENLLVFDPDLSVIDLQVPNIKRSKPSAMTSQKRRLIERKCKESSTLEDVTDQLSFDSILHGVCGLGNSVGICAAFSKDCDFLAVGTVTGDIYVNWHRTSCRDYPPDNADNAQFDLISGHSGAVYEMSWSKNQQLLISASSDGTVKCWRTATKDCIATFSAPGPIWSVDLSPLSENLLVCGTNKESINVYALDHPNPIRQFSRDIHGAVTCVRFHGNDNYIASGGVDRTVRLFDIRSGTLVRSFTGHKGIVSSLRFSLDGKYLISGCEMGKANIWDLTSSNWLLKSLSSDAYSGNSRGAVMNMDLCRNLQLLVVGRREGQIDVWDYRALIGSNAEQQGRSYETNQFGSSLCTETDSDESMLYLVTDPRRAGLCDTLYTKTFPVMALQFSRRDILHCCVFYSGLLRDRSP